MAIGFPPKHIHELLLDNITPQQFLAIAIESATRLGWSISYASEIGFIAFTKLSFRSWGEEITVKISDHTVNLRSENQGSGLMDWGRNERNIEGLIAQIDELKSMLSPEKIDNMVVELSPNLIPKEDDILSKEPTSLKEKFNEFLSVFIPIDGYFVTPILLNINILIFIIMALTGVNIIAPDGESLIRWGANFRPVTLEGEGWRLLTNCFLHIGIFHLAMNMYALAYIGLLLEPHLGKTRFISGYLLTGITASVASLWWHDLTISAGASGAIFGLYGVFLAMLTTSLIEETTRKALLTSITVFVGYNLVIGLKGGIDNAAHIGGLLGGIVIGYAFIPSLKQPESEHLKLSTIALLTALIFSGSFFIYKNLPNDIGEYDKKVTQFVSMESMALEFYSLPSDTPKDKKLYAIKDRGIYYWKENIKLLNSFEKLDLPVEIKTKTNLLKDYCELRIKSYQLIYKAVAEETDRYEGQINALDKKIETVINDLRALQEKSK